MKQIFKAVALGILIGAAFFVMPFFLLKLFLFFMIIGAIFRLVWGGKHRRGGWGPGYKFAMADKIRNMSDEEYNTFKNNVQQNHCGYHHYHMGYGNKKTQTPNTESTTETTNN